MTKEEKLNTFYSKFVTISEKDVLSSTIAFEEIVCAMLIGNELQEIEIGSFKFYEFLLLWNITYNNYQEKGVTSSIIEPFAFIDEMYYQSLVLSYQNDFLFKQKVCFISELTKNLEFDEPKTSTFLLKQAKPELVATFKFLSKLKQVMRKGWIVRNVPSKNWENDQTHSIQMLALASAYFRLYNPTLNQKKVFEMIIIHEIGEVLVGDIREGTKEHKNKHERERKAMLMAFEGLESKDYFIQLWDEFESRETKEAKFVYELDKLDPILKASYYDKLLNRSDLFEDFYTFEEKRATFSETFFSTFFSNLKK